MCAAPLRPASIARQVSRTLFPSGVMAPIPVTTTRVACLASDGGVLMDVHSRREVESSQKRPNGLVNAHGEARRMRNVKSSRSSPSRSRWPGDQRVCARFDAGGRALYVARVAIQPGEHERALE